MTRRSQRSFASGLLQPLKAGGSSLPLRSSPQPPCDEMRVSVRNSLERDTLTFYVPARIADATRGATLDSVVLAPDEVRELRIRAERPGNYLYHANGRTPLDRAIRVRGFLTGAIIVDSAGSAPRAKDRILVLLSTTDSVTSIGVPDTRREVRAINGRSWPHTERLDATRWQVNSGALGCDMHLLQA